eukprot:gnl/MRDRNA2_/MRDRNA2_82442_c0_seq2.p1 gnl/MRDRNA2_/MRDRNA2_82442_c0~~gnl/MRDRNA2_/MRDRNA2_82442_c0_seq2.p1  ORF type:complete len:440 (+),score=63.51 gnl/MRDRNA2_/MRDRNA2_82442_c0_seq2:109-1428(+)
MFAFCLFVLTVCSAMQGSSGTAIEGSEQQWRLEKEVVKSGGGHQSLDSQTTFPMPGMAPIVQAVAAGPVNPVQCDGILGVKAAQWGVLTSPWAVRTDSDGGQAVGKEDTSNNNALDNGPGMAAFDMCCTESATVTFRAMVNAPDQYHDSFKVSTDGSSWTTWHITDTPADSYTVQDVSGSYSMNNGTGTVYFKNREDGTFLRAVYIKSGGDKCTFGACNLNTPQVYDNVVCSGVLGVDASKWAVLTWPFQNITADPGAVGKMYGDGDDYSFNSTGGKAVFNLDCSNDTNVTFETLVKAPSNYHDSFWLKLDSASHTLWHIPGTATTYSIKIPSTTYLMTAGSHTFTFFNREDGSYLRAFYIKSGDQGCTFARAAGSPQTSSLAALGDGTAILQEQVDPQLSNSSTFTYVNDKTMRRETFNALQMSVRVNHHGSFHIGRP